MKYSSKLIIIHMILTYKYFENYSAFGLVDLLCCMNTNDYLIKLVQIMLHSDVT